MLQLLCAADGQSMTTDIEVDLVARFKNEEYWLQYFVQGIASQIGVKINVIGIDNKSTDRSVEIFSSLSDADCVKSLKIIELDNFLPGFALNLGAEAGQAPYIVNISAHCVPKLPTYLIELIQELEVEDNRCAGVFGGQLPLHCSGPQNTIDLVLTYPREERIYRRTPIFNNANSIIKREIFKTFHFDNEVSNLEDVIWAKSVLDEGYELKYTPRGAVYHYHGPHQHIHISGRADKSLAVLLSKNWISIDKPKFLDLAQKNILLIGAHFHFMENMWGNPIFREVKGGRVIEIDFVDLASMPNSYDHFLWVGDSPDDKVISFARVCSELATEAAFLNEEGDIVFCDYVYESTPIENLIEIISHRKTVYVSARVSRLLINTVMKNG